MAPDPTEALGEFLGRDGDTLVFENGYLRLNNEMGDNEPARQLLKWTTGGDIDIDPAAAAEADRLEHTWEVGLVGFCGIVKHLKRLEQAAQARPILAALTKLVTLARLGTRALCWLAPTTPALVDEVAATARRRRSDAGGLSPAPPVGGGQRRGAAAVGTWLRNLMEVSDVEEENGLPQFRGGSGPRDRGQGPGSERGPVVLAWQEEGRQSQGGVDGVGDQGRGHEGRRRPRRRRPPKLKPLGGPGRAKRR